MANFVIMGPPGVGKGAQAVHIVESRKVRHVSTGNILRAAVLEGSDLGREVEAVMARGELVSDRLMIALVRRTLEGPEGRSGWLMDGFPRTVDQADSLLEMLPEVGQAIDKVIVLDVPDDEILRRLRGRLTCRSCSKTTAKTPDGGPETCPACGQDTLYTRQDDKEETIRHRLDIFRSQTRPAAERLGSKYDLALIDGLGSPDEVWQRIASVLE